ncbi:MAG: hypothetical protein AB1442_08280, partial [Nitrospirota bacterium]
TPLFSYQLNLKSTLVNSHTTDEEGKTTTDYLRAVEPALDIFFRHPIYGVEAGARRLEQWDTADLEHDSRRTTEYYYSRFTVKPYGLPNLSLQIDRQRDYDHISPRDIDTTDTKFTGISWYDLAYRGWKLSYNIAYIWDEFKTPLEDINKTVNNNVNLLYNIGYNKAYFSNRLSVAAGYQGNYVRNKTESFARESGSIEVRRTSQSGQYGHGTQLDPVADTLSPTPSLTDGVYVTAATTSSGTINIGLNGSRFHNIGLQNQSGKSVSSIFVYVSKNVTTDTNLTNADNWSIFRSNTNPPNSDSWTEVTIESIEGALFDAINNIYRYEIRLASPQDAIFLNAVTMETATLSDVFITEIEAWGIDVFEKGKNVATTTFFTHGINLSTTFKPAQKLSFTLNYYLNRTDQDPESVWNSIGGAFENIAKKPDSEKDSSQEINVTRTYGISTTWLTTSFLTTTVRYQRNEAFDNKEKSDQNKTDLKSDSYSLTLSSAPLPTLDTNLTFIRTYSYSFDQKQSVNDLVLLSVGSRLHRDVNMITDAGYTNTKTYPVRLPSSDSATEKLRNSTWYIRGTLDARLTLKVTANLTYGLSFLSGDTSGHSHDGTFIITYRPGRFISLSGTFHMIDSDEESLTSQGALADWLIVPAVRINLHYEHSHEKPETTDTHTVGGYVLWYITKFLDFQFTYDYSRSENDIKTETFNLGGNLTCRFW